MLPKYIPNVNLTFVFIPDDPKRRKQVKDGLNKRTAKTPGEKSARAIYNLLPEDVKGKDVRAEVVYKLLSLLDKSDFRRISKDEVEFKEQVRSFLDSPIGQKWSKCYPMSIEIFTHRRRVNDWLQPYPPPTDNTEAELPSLPSFLDLEGNPKLIKDGKSSFLPEFDIATIASGSSSVILPTQNEVVSIATTHLRPPHQHRALQRRRASDSALMPLYYCRNCGGIHQNPHTIVFEMPEAGHIVDEAAVSGTSLLPAGGLVLAARRNRTNGLVYNRLMMVMSGMSVASLVFFITFYGSNIV